MTWEGKFGDAYTLRNEQPVDYVSRFGKTRHEMFADVFGRLPRKINILEVGCNVGNQLAVLRDMGFTNLHGIDINATSVAIAVSRGFDVKKGSAFDIVAENNEFELVFTAGVLIHFSPGTLPRLAREFYRVSGGFIGGFEYHANPFVKIPYRDGVELWKGDHVTMYTKLFPRLRVVAKKLYEYKDQPGNVDCGFLLAKEA